MKHSAKKRLALLAALVIACPQAAAPVFAAEGERESQPAASAAAAMSVQEESSKRVGVIVTPFKDITFGQTPGDPSAVQVDQGNGIDENAAFTYRYVGVGKTNYNSKKKPLEAGRYQVIATLDSATHSGEGVSVPFAIRKAEDGSIKRSITVSVIEEKQTIHLSDLNLYSGMEKGARIKRVSKGSGDDIFETVTVGADAASVDLNMKPVEDGASQILTLILESDNYKKLTAIVTVTAVVTAEDIEVIHTEVKAPGVFSYGTPLKDIIDLEKCAATLNGRSISGTFTLLEPEKRYNVGEDTEVALRFTTSGGKEYIKTVPIEFTIEPLDVTPIGYDEQFFNDGYYILIYANSPYNVSEKTLEELIPARKDSFKVAVGEEEIELDASWTANENNPPFEVQGQKPHT